MMRKRVGVAIIAGITVFGAATAFASSLSVSSKSVVAGAGAVNACNTTASVSYNTTYSAGLPGYVVTTVPVTTAATCGGMSYKVTLMNAANAPLAEKIGSLDSSGNATADFTASSVSVALINGVAVIVTG